MSESIKPAPYNFSIRKFNSDKSFDYENGFYMTSSYTRTGRLLAHYEVYKMINRLPGDIVECGVFRGASLMRFINFLQLFEGENCQRKVIGFDTFGDFPSTTYEADQEELTEFINETGGGQSISKNDLEFYIHSKDFENSFLVQGNILETVPEFVKAHPGLQIALLNIDTDIYEPCKVILEHLAPLVVEGGVIIFDDYGVFEGETKLADDYAKANGYQIKQFPFSNVPSYLVKQK